MNGPTTIEVIETAIHKKAGKVLEATASNLIDPIEPALAESKTVKCQRGWACLNQRHLVWPSVPAAMIVIKACEMSEMIETKVLRLMLNDQAGTVCPLKRRTATIAQFAPRAREIHRSFHFQEWTTHRMPEDDDL